jgi:uncharacterized protein
MCKIDMNEAAIATKERVFKEMPFLIEIISRIIEVSQPEKIILFGSAARGEMGLHSDLDVLVVAGSGTHRRRLAQKIYRNMIGVGYPIDVIVVTPQDIEQYGNAIGLILEPALREGKTIYEREAALLSDYAVEAR